MASNPSKVRTSALATVACLAGALGPPLTGCGPSVDVGERARSASLTPSDGAPPARESGSHLQVDVVAEEVSVDARNVRVGEVLEEIVRQSGLVLISYAPLSERITLQLERLPLSEALRRILRDRSFALQKTQTGRRGKLWIFSSHPDRSNDVRSVQGARESFAWASGALTHPEKETRLDAVSVLGGVGNHNAAMALVTAALSDAAPEVREEALFTLGEIGDETSVPFLKLALGDPDADVREAALEALGEIGGESAMRLLRQTAASGHPSIRDAAAEVLDDLTDRE